jgi:PAS domain S-box-containing protein
MIEPKYTKSPYKKRAGQMQPWQQRFDEFAYRLPDALVEADIPGERLTYMNLAAYFLFGYTESDFTQGIAPSQLFAEGEFERAEEILKQYIAESINFKIPYERSEEARYYEFLMRKKDGSSFSAETHTTFLLNKDGVPTTMRTIIRDISERKRLEKQLREMEEMKSHFFANISHEFRTPLTLILGYIEKNLRRTDDEESVRALELIERNANDLLRLVNLLLDLAKLDANQMGLQTTSGDIVECLKTLTSGFSVFAAQKQIALRFRAEEESIEMYFDREKVEGILSNLLFNALKFTPQGGQVSVTVISPSNRPSPENKKGVEGENVQIVVRDTGVGIPAERLAHIFDRFFQVHGSSHEYNGTGLGLSLVKELVALHHGTVQVESDEGLGTTFTVFLPRGKHHLNENEVVDGRTFKQEANGHAELKTSGLDETVSGSKTDATNGSDDTLILVIEDHTDLRAYIRECLEPAYKVVEAQDGAAGMVKALQAIPDLVVCDVMMPKLNGYEVCHNLKTDERTSHIPVILLTAKAAKEDKIKGLKEGADDYLIKPFDSQELLARIKNLIDLRRKLRERYRSTVYLRPSEIATNSLDEVFLKRVLQSVEKNLGQEDYDVETLSTEVGLSQSQIYRKLRALTNHSTAQVIQSVRLRRAADLLRQKAGTIAEIAYSVGFSSQAYFTKCFRERFGYTPLKYMRDRN